jgi:hypothetical protein
MRARKAYRKLQSAGEDSCCRRLLGAGAQLSHVHFFLLSGNSIAGILQAGPEK